MNFKKIIALAMAVITVFALVACGNTKREIVKLTLSTEDAEAILAAAGIRLPDVEEASAAGTVIKYFGWNDDLHNYSEDEIVNTGFWTFTEKYGCEAEWVECDYLNRYDELSTYVLGGDPPDAYPGYDSSIFPSYCIKGVFSPVDDYIDYSTPLWEDMKLFADQYFSIGGDHYLILTDRTHDNVVCYNRRVMEEWGFDDPADLYYNDEWTWDIFYNMCVDFSDPDENRYALDGWAFDSGLMHSCGTAIVKLNTETGLFESNMDEPAIERAANLLYNLNKEQCIYPWYDNGWTTRNGVEGGGMKEGDCLFYIRGTWVITGTVDEISNVFGDITAGEVMFVPLPRDPQGDGHYYTESKPAGYAIIKGASNPEGVALLASCERFKILDPTVVSIDRKQLEEIYHWNDEMLHMYDNVYELANSDNTILLYGDGFGGKLSSTVSSIECTSRGSTADTWAQLKEKYESSLQYYIDELNKDMEEYIENNR